MSRAHPRLPATRPGMTVALFGGSFDPPHAGHRHASDMALDALGADRVWWLVTPGNPLKDVGRLPPLPARIVAAALVVWPSAEPSTVGSAVDSPSV